MCFKRIIPCLFFILLAVSCRKEEKFLKGEGELKFTTDTVYFDTVFTKLPGSNYPRSINKRFLIHNPYKESVKVNVRLLKGNSSEFRINVDGRTGRVIPEVEILPEDSAWVFVEATLEPNFGNDPLVRDEIEFETNGNKQYIHLAAYGWDAYYIKDSVISTNTSFILKDKPYVIVNTMFVDDDVTLTIGPGLHFYCSPNSVVTVNNRQLTVGTINVFGTLKINGTKTEPVIFEGDRLGLEFKEKAGQWRGLRFWRGSTNNEIKHALIKNATIGIQVDSLPESGTHNLTVRNTVIRNISGYGVLGQTAKLYLENTSISNCGLNTFLGYYGGDYTLIHCSLYSGSNGRRDPQMIFNNALRDQNQVVIRNYDIRFAIVNSIIWGTLKTEVAFDFVNQPPANQLVFKNNIFKSENNFSDATNKWNVDPKFIDQSNNNLRLNNDSPAKDAADGNNSPPTDLEEKPRNGTPDIGAYEI